MAPDIFEWQKRVVRDETLRDIAKDEYFDIRLVALTIAMSGEAGCDCFESAETVAELIGCERKTIERKRAELIRLGWFTVASRTGGWNKRALVLNIALPGTGNGKETA
jgi:Helix-turn-helix domain